MRRFRRALALVVLGALVPTLAAAKAQRATHLDAKIRAEQAKLHDVHLRLNDKRSELDSAKARELAVQSQLAETNRNIAAVDGNLDAIQAHIRSTQRRLAWNRIQLQAAQATVRRHQDALDHRLVDAYEHGDLGYLDVLLRARSFGDFIERWNDIRYLVKANETTIRLRRADEAKVDAIRAGLVGSQSELESQQAAAEQQHRALDALAVERHQLLAVADAQRQQVQTQVQELDEMSADEEARLNGLIWEKQQEALAERRAERRAALLSGEALPPEPSAPGELMWPVSGPITSPFGYRMHPVFHRMMFHAGIDIGVPEGTTIAAAATGKVIVADDEGACGNMIALDHGGGLSTIYCHLSQIFVGVGQDVEKGQAIGAVGMTGDATGPHLHFQVDVNGQPVDPMGYLR